MYRETELEILDCPVSLADEMLRSSTSNFFPAEVSNVSLVASFLSIHLARTASDFLIAGQFYTYYQAIGSWKLRWRQNDLLH